jgi:translocation and assembly module TamB
MTRAQRVAVWAGLVVASLLLVLALALLVLTRTDWGREQVRVLAEGQLENLLDAQVEIGRVEGNLLVRWRFVDLEIRDLDGRPFVTADTLATRFALRPLLRQRIELYDVRLVRPLVLLDQPPGERWNYARILPDPPEVPGPPGWGSWVVLEDVTLVGGRVTVRSEWKPDPELSPAERERKVAEALSPDSRPNVQRVPGGFQNIMDFRGLHARLSHVLLADPDVDRTEIDVELLRGILQPYRPPAADVRALAGRFRISADSIWFQDVQARLPGSRLAGSGVYHLETADLILELEGAPAAFDDLRWLYPTLPREGGGDLRLSLQSKQAATRIAAQDMDLAVRDSRVAGDLRLVMGDTFRILPTDLRFTDLDTRLMARLIPDLDLPRHGTLDGRLALQGVPAAMRVDGDLTFRDAVAGASRVLARGGLDMQNGVRFADLRVELRPLRTDLLRGELPELPAGAAMTGTARLDGALAGPLRLDADLVVDDPATGRSRVAAAGALGWDPGAMRFTDFRMRFDPLRVNLVRAQLPQLPAGAALTGRLRLDGSTAALLNVDGDLDVRDPDSGLSRVAAAGGVHLDGPLRFRNLDLRFAPLRTDLVREVVPDLPPGATLTGPLRLDGNAEGLLRLDGDLSLQDPATGESRVLATGAVDLAGPPAFRDLELRLAPLQLPLVRRFEPDLPLGGTLAGTATLNGRPGGTLAVRADLVHDEAGERSHVAGLVELVPDDRTRVDVRLMPLSLVTAGRFAPEAGLRGQVEGTVQAAGALGDLNLRADLTVPGGGALVATGTLDLAAADPGYDMETRLQAFDLAAVTDRAPAATDLTGAIDAAGRGLDPATMRARIRADLVGSAVDDLAADEVRLRLALEQGLATLDSSLVRLGPTLARAHGSFGLVAGRFGELSYRVEVDSLHVVEPWLPPGDTGRAEPRPPVREAALSEAQEAVRREERRRLVEALATGREPPPGDVPYDTLALEGIPRDAVAGSLHAGGTLRGNLERFDLEGTAEAEELVFRGNRVGSGEADFAWLRLSLPEPALRLDAAGERLLIEGFALDSARAHVRHRGEAEGEGEALLVAWQDDRTSYWAEFDFSLGLERNEILFRDVALNFDTIFWQSVEPGVVRWNGDGVELETIHLASDAGGEIFVDGRLPAEAEAALDVRLREVRLAHVSLLLQDDSDLDGRLGLDARVEGTLAAPRGQGEALLEGASRNGQTIPDLRATFRYEGRELAVDGELFEEGAVVAQIEGTLPLNLAVVDRAGPLLIEGPLALDVVADSLPVDAFPALTDALSDAEGFLAGDLSIRGSWQAATVEGELALADGAFRVNATGVRYRDVNGWFRLDGTTLVVDSLVGRAGGPVRVTGEVALANLTRPAFDLEIQATNAWAMRTDDLQLRLDADLTVEGPFDRVVVNGRAATQEGVIYIPETRGKNVVELDDPDLLDLLERDLLERFANLIEEPSPLLANLEVDVELEIALDTWVRSTDYNVEIYTPAEVGPLRVLLDQRAGRLTLEGVVISDRGDYSFMGRRFRVARGSATFVRGGEIDPLLQITAEHEVQLPGREGLSLRVIISGTALNPTLSVESDARPPISQTELFTYVALGRAAGSVLQQQGSVLAGPGAAGGDMVGNVAGLATMQMTAVAATAVMDEFESEMARQLGLDVIHISPADLPAELFSGRFGDLLRGTEVEMGRYIGRRLFASVRARPTTETRPGATLEYRTRGGFRFTTSLDPTFLPPQPTLRELDPDRTSVFGALIFHEWRF